MDELQELVERVLARDFAAVGRAISLVEDRRPRASERSERLLQLLRTSGRAAAGHCLGLTGPPGAGKSTLVSALARAARRRALSVGVLAVDPSSPRSGGALLGDRVRIEGDPDDELLYVRSMASGGDLGGLARAAGAAVEVLTAAYELVVVETVGVGQSETDVEHVSDTVVLVVQPASGDLLQFIKAGILEIPDVLVVNKLDLGPVATRAAAELRAALAATHPGRQASVPPVVLTSAATSDGVDELLDRCAEHRAQLAATGALEAERAARRRRWAYRLFRDWAGARGVQQLGGRAHAEARLALLLGEGRSAWGAASALAEQR